MNTCCRLDLTPVQKSALVILLNHGSLIREGHHWASASGARVPLPTILALYERYLVKIVVESKYRKRQAAKLTDVGEYAAAEIERQLLHPADREGRPGKPTAGLSEKAARFIVEVTS